MSADKSDLSFLSDEARELFEKHRGGEGPVILAMASNGGDDEFGVFSSIEMVAQWKKSLGRDYGVECIPFIVDHPGYGEGQVS